MYNNQPTALQNFWQNTNATQKVAVLLIPLALMGIVIIAVASLMSGNKTGFDDTDAYHVNITNFEITGGTRDYQLALQKYLWVILQYSNVPYNTDTTAAIRDGSLRQTSSDTTVGSSFLVDIPDLRQTFAVEYDWPKDSKRIDTSEEDAYAIAVSCPVPAEVIYAGEICMISNDPYDTIDQYLPYHGYTQNLTVAIEKERYADPYTDEGVVVEEYSEDELISPSLAGRNFLWVTLDTCGKPELLAEGKEYLRGWLVDRLANPDDFLVEYYEYCDS